jgi:hypothetical protein
LSAAQVVKLVTGMNFGAPQGTVTSAEVISGPVSDGTSETGRITVHFSSGASGTLEFRIFKKTLEHIDMCDLSTPLSQCGTSG